MGFIVSGLLLFIAIISYWKKKTIASPEIFYCIEWAIITGLAALQLYTLYEVSWKTWFIVAIGSVSFVLGTIFGNKISIRNKYFGKAKICEKRDLLSKKWFWICFGIVVLELLPDLYQSIRYLNMGYGLDEIRAASYGIIKLEGYTKNTGYFALIFDTAISALKLFVVASGINYFICDMKANYKMIIGILILEILSSITSGGRFNLIYLILELFVCYSIYKSSGGFLGIKITKKMKRRIAIIGVILAIITVFVSSARKIVINDLIKSLYVYLCGNLVFFDLHVIEMENFLSLSFSGVLGFWSLILPALNYIGISYPSIYLDTLTKVIDTQTYRRIGDNLNFNAFITPFYHLYADFRLFSVIIGMFIFGALASKLYKNAKSNMSGIDIVYYLIIVQMIFKSLQMYPLTNQTYVFTLFTMFFISLFRRMKLYIK